jgi:D-alanyl-D-alanine carboxypeptidase
MNRGMAKWLPYALDYIPRWIEFQMRQTEQPGCAIAIAEKGEIVLEQAFGHADLDRGVALTPRHRHRVASHSKSFTTAGILKLRERGKLRLDDPVGNYVDGLHRAIGEATIAQLLSHSAGLVRDGWDSGQWADRRPFLNPQELRADLAAAPIIAANTRFKYSNHGFGLAGMVIEAITGEPYRDWIEREIVAAAGLAETAADMPVTCDVPVAKGHSGKLPAGRRVVIPGDNPTNALAPATGFVSTAADLACFFAQLDPAAGRSVLSPGSRREMVRRQWRDPHSSFETYYGLGITSGRLGDCDWFGHGGGFQGFITRTGALPEYGLSISVLTNAVDGWAPLWWTGIVQILARFARHGGPTARVRDWTGRWWTPWYAIDLLPMGRQVTIAAPAFLNPVADASEIAVLRPDEGRIALANGFANHGEPVRRTRDADGAVKEIWLGGTRFIGEQRIVAELAARYPKPRAAPKPPGGQAAARPSRRSARSAQ